MNRRLALTVCTLAVAGLAAAPAHAAGVVKGSYDVTLLPDPSLEAAEVCEAVLPTAVDNHELKVPGPGTLTVVLDSPDPTGTGNTDWDLYILDADGSVNSGSDGGSSHEEAAAKFKKAATVTLQVCNLAGAPNGTVSYVFTPKK
ncbi:MAG: hypothetical protein QOE05_3524 [Actinomycetota bacterium]|jgi:hypothetical protein|nr:hypothetical protein [Actinomycetota bacterium]